MRRHLALAACLLLPAAGAVAQADAGAAPVMAGPAYPREIELQACSARGVPVPGALIELWEHAMAAGAPPLGEPGVPAAHPAARSLGAWTCDDSGRARLLVPSREAVVVASVPGLLSSGLWQADGLEGEAPVLLLFPLGEVRGVACTLAGMPVAGARVEFRTPPAGPAWTDGVRGPGRPRGPQDVLAGPDGSFHVPVDWGWRGTAHPSLDGRAGEPVAVTWVSGRYRPHLLPVPGPWFVRGLCVDETGRPVPGVSLVARAEGAAQSSTALSDAQGRFELAARSGGTVRVGVEPPVAGADGTPLLAPADAVVRLEVDRPEGVTLVRLVRAAAIEVRVLDPAGQPLARRATLQVQPRGRAPPDLAFADAEGRCRVEGLDPWTPCDLLVQLGGPPSVRRVRSVRPGGPALELRLGPHDELAGRCTVHVRDASTGQPVDSLVLQLSWPATWDSPLGRVPRDAPRDTRQPLVLDALPLDVPTGLEVRARGYAPARVAELPVDRGDAAVLDVRLQPLAPLAVRVLSPDGSPGGAARVVVHELPRSGEPPAWRADATADGDGHLTLSACAVAGERLLLEASAGGLSSGLVERVAPPPGIPVELRLQDGPPRAFAAVRVADAAGHPVMGAVVLMAPERIAPSGAGACSATTDATGMARFEALPHGCWSVSLPHGPGTARTSLLLTADGPAACELRVGDDP